MNDFFGFLMLSAFLAVVVGLIKPSLVVFWRKPPTRWKATSYAGLLVVAFSGSAITLLEPTIAEQAEIVQKRAGRAATKAAIAQQESLANPSCGLQTDLVQGVGKDEKGNF